MALTKHSRVAVQRGLRRLATATVDLILLLLQLGTLAAAAPEDQKTLRVETFVAPPFVIEQEGKLTGFSIDLWNETASRLRVASVYEKAPTASAGFAALRSKQADLAVSAILVTAERDREFDFSYPILEAGQQVMVRDTGSTLTVQPLSDLLHLLFSKTTAIWLIIGLPLVFLPAHVVWLLERRQKEGIIPTERYFPGIFYAAYWSASALFMQAEQMPRQWLARLTALLWMFTGMVFVALYTAQLTATLSDQEIRGDINGPEDLPGKQVGTLAGSASVTYLRQHNAKVEEFTQLTELFQALIDKKVNAVLLTAPALRYYQTHEGTGLVKTVGPEFNRGILGFVFPENSSLRRPVNAELVAMREDGTYQRLYDKWFGGDGRVANQ